MRKKLLRLLRLAPLALLFASSAFAQTTSTLIGVVTDASTGKPVEGALVVATSVNLQGEQTALTGKDGSYQIRLLPPGQYKLVVQLAGYRPGERTDIRLGLDKTLRANVAVVPEAVQLEEQVVKTGTAPVINVASAESGQVVSKEFISAIPVGRTFESVAITVPGAVQDTLGIGFSGGQSLDNAYILDGLNISDPAFAGNSSNLLTNFTEEVDIKTGSFMAEYGRATGGVVNVVTKSGSNEFHGSVFSSLRPDWLVKPNGIPAGSAGRSAWLQEKPGNGSYNTDFGAEIGGPILKDKLWFYAGFAPRLQATDYERYIRAPRASLVGTTLTRTRDASGNFIYDDVDSTRKKYEASLQEYQYTGKLTYLVNENNTVSLALYGSNLTRDDFASTSASEARRMLKQEFTTLDVNARYAGKFLDKKLIIEGIAGVHRQTGKYLPRDYTFLDEGGAPTTVSQSNDPRIQHVNFDFSWALSSFEQAPGTCTDGSHLCTVTTYNSGGLGFVNLGDTATRYAGRVSASYLANAAGSHNFKGGVDIQRDYYDFKKKYSGGGLYQLWDQIGFAQVRGYGYVKNGASDSADPNDLVYGDGSAHAKTVTQSNALFVQDSWQILDSGVTLNAGLRWETQSMQDNASSSSPKLSINDNIAPRLQIIYDPTKTGRAKLSANWGRFYEMIPLDMADRAFGSEQQAQVVYSDDNTGAAANFGGYAGLNYIGLPVCNGQTYTGTSRAYNPRNCPINPTGGGDFGIIDINGNVVNMATIGGVSPVAPDLKGMYVDQFGAAAEYELLSDLSVGVEYQGRRLGRAIEDMSSNDGASYFIGNPGESKPWDYHYDLYNVTQTLNPQGVTAFDAFTNRSYFAPFVKPKRDYDGVTFKVAKNFSRGWQAFGSYTYSSLRGNYTGLFNPENGQTDPNLTSQYDLPGLLPNRQGPLNGDHPHMIKLYGSYTWNATQKLAITGGGGYTGLSGSPVNILGGHPLYGASEAFVLPRGVGGRGPFVNTFDAKAGIEYVIKAPYAVKFTVDLFNVLNEQTAQTIDQDWTTSSILPIVGGTCKSKNAAGKANPIAAAVADCPDLAYLRTTSGGLPTINSNWGKPVAATTAFQAARSLRLGLILSF